MDWQAEKCIPRSGPDMRARPDCAHVCFLEHRDRPSHAAAASGIFGFCRRL